MRLIRTIQRYRIYIVIALLCIGVVYYGLYDKRRKTTEGFTYPLPRVIWSYWNDPQIPPKLRNILRQREEVLYTWDHRVLNEESVYDYIPRDSFPEGYDALIHQHKADWIRLYILKNYGGCWMDSSIIVNSDSEIEHLYEESVLRESEFTGFYLLANTLNSVKETYIENWFIMAPARSKVISLWYEEFTEAVTTGFLVYKKKVSAAINVSNLYGGEEDTYLTQHASLQYVLQKRLPAKPNILIVDASDTMFKPHIDCKWDSSCVVKYIRDTPKDKQPPYIKLRGNERSEL